MDDYKNQNNGSELPRLAYSVQEAAQVLGVSATTVYRLVKRGHLRRVKGLRHLLIPKVELEKFVSNLDDDGGAR